jgi:hypothetical protein
MKEIANNDYYELYYDKSSNCIYWTIKGFWKDMSVVPDFHKDWDEARKYTKSGWKIYSDAVKAKVVPPEVRKEKIKNQNKSLKSGCVKIARIVDSAITKVSLKNELDESGFDGVIKQFSKGQEKEAQEWLNK